MTKTTGIEPTTEAAGDAPFGGIKARFRVQEANTLLSNAFTLDQAAHNLVYISRWQSHFGGVARPCL